LLTEQFLAPGGEWPPKLLQLDQSPFPSAQENFLSQFHLPPFWKNFDVSAQASFSIFLTANYLAIQMEKTS
jgi:hypothetical protein